MLSALNLELIIDPLNHIDQTDQILTFEDVTPEPVLKVEKGEGMVYIEA
jgi:hypothetical protein